MNEISFVEMRYTTLENPAPVSADDMIRLSFDVGVTEGFIIVNDIDPFVHYQLYGLDPEEHTLVYRSPNGRKNPIEVCTFLGSYIVEIKRKSTTISAVSTEFKIALNHTQDKAYLIGNGLPGSCDIRGNNDHLPFWFKTMNLLHTGFDEDFMIDLKSSYNNASVTVEVFDHGMRPVMTYSNSASSSSKDMPSWIRNKGERFYYIKVSRKEGTTVKSEISVSFTMAKRVRSVTYDLSSNTVTGSEVFRLDVVVSPPDAYLAGAFHLENTYDDVDEMRFSPDENSGSIRHHFLSMQNPGFRTFKLGVSSYMGRLAVESVKKFEEIISVLSLHPTYWEGEGTVASPFLVDTPEKLLLTHHARTANFRQTTNLNMSGYTVEEKRAELRCLARGHGFRFLGSYNGSNYEINNAYMQGPFFGSSEGSIFKNIRVNNSYFEGNLYESGIINSQSFAGGFSNCIVSDSTMIHNISYEKEVYAVGSITGAIYESYNFSTGAYEQPAMFDCYSSNVTVIIRGVVEGSSIDELGGLVGYIDTTSVKRCAVDNFSIICETLISDYVHDVGGFSGSAYDSAIVDCHVRNANIFLANNFNGIASKLSGFSSYARRTIFNRCSTSGFNISLSSPIEDPYSSSRIGGFLAIGYENTFTNCYAKGSFDFSALGASFPFSDTVGSFIGYDDDDNVIENCYTSINFIVAGGNSRSLVKGFSGIGTTNLSSTYTNAYYNTTSVGVTPDHDGTAKTYDEMVYQSTFSGFDFNNVWSIDEGYDTPVLTKIVGWGPGAPGWGDWGNWGDLGDWYDDTGFPLYYGYLGVPLTYYVRHARVVPHVNGNLSFNGVLWKIVDVFYAHRVPPESGVAGQQKTYTVDTIDKLVYANEEGKSVNVTFLASGVRDKNGANGFSAFTDQQTRTVTVNAEMEAVVDFYFTEPHHLGDVPLKLKVATPNGVVEAVVEPNTKPQEFGLSLGSGLANVPLVGRLTSKALPIRVNTKDGVKALERWTPTRRIKVLDK